MPIIQITNNKTEIINTNYFESLLNKHGKFYVSINAGAFRLLIPDVYLNTMEKELPLAQKMVITRDSTMFNILFEDYSETPYQIQLSSNSFDRLPSQQDKGRDFIFSAWTKKGGKIKKIFETICEYHSI